RPRFRDLGIQPLHFFPGILVDALEARDDDVAFLDSFLAFFEVERLAMTGRGVVRIIEGIFLAARRQHDHQQPRCEPTVHASSAACCASSPGSSRLAISASSSWRNCPRDRPLSSFTAPIETRRMRLTRTPWRSNSWRMSLPLAPRTITEYQRLLPSRSASLE